MGKSRKKDKRLRNEEAVKLIKDKQSQKKKEQKRIQKMTHIKKSEKARRQEIIKVGQQEEPQIQTKKQERAKFIQLIGKAGWYEKRVDAEVADQKRKEAYLKYVDYTPKLEEKKYCGKAWEGTYKRWDGKGDR